MFASAFLLCCGFHFSTHILCGSPELCRSFEISNKALQALFNYKIG